LDGVQRKGISTDDTIIETQCAMISENN
jgi:hypothetical protein